MCLNGRCSSFQYNNVGVPQGTVLSPFLFSLHSDSLSPCHSRLLKFGDDFVLCNSYSKCSDQEGLDDDLHRLATWSADHGFIINKTKCMECLFNLKNTSSNSRSPSSTVKLYLDSKRWSILVYVLPRTWLWYTRIDTVFTKCLRLSFLSEWFHSMNVHKSLLWRIVSARAMPLILYCSPIIFPELLNKDFTSFKNAYVCYQRPVV